MQIIPKEKKKPSPVLPGHGHEEETSNMGCPGRCNPAIGTPLKTQRGHRGVGKVSGQLNPPRCRSNSNMTLDWAHVDVSLMKHLLISDRTHILTPQNQAPTMKRMSSKHART